MNIAEYLQNVPEVTFIEYHLSKLPDCRSPLLPYYNPRPKTYWISAHSHVLDAINTKSSFYHYEIWTVEYLRDEFRKAGLSEKKSLKLFRLSCKLLILKKINQFQKPLIILTRGAVIRLVAPILRQELPRQVFFEKCLFDSFVFDKMFVYFQDGKLCKASEPILHNISKLVSKIEPAVAN